MSILTMAPQVKHLVMAAGVADYRYYSTPVSQDSAPYAISGF